LNHSSFATLVGFTIVGACAALSLGGCAVREDVGRDPQHLEHREDHPADHPGDRPGDRPADPPHSSDHPGDSQRPEDHPH
jgi:hypothetical protein